MHYQDRKIHLKSPCSESKQVVTHQEIVHLVSQSMSGTEHERLMTKLSFSPPWGISASPISPKITFNFPSSFSLSFSLQHFTHTLLLLSLSLSHSCFLSFVHQSTLCTKAPPLYLHPPLQCFYPLLLLPCPHLFFTIMIKSDVIHLYYHPSLWFVFLIM